MQTKMSQELFQLICENVAKYASSFSKLHLLDMFEICDMPLPTNISLNFFYDFMSQRLITCNHHALLYMYTDNLLICSYQICCEPL